MTLVTLIFSGIILFVASLTKGATGFGFGLLAMPLLLLFLPPSFAIPLVLGLAFVDEIILQFSIKGRVKIKRILPLLIGGIAGVPFGYFMLDTFSEDSTSVVVSALIIIIGILVLTRRLRHIPDNPIARLIVGGFSGAVHGVSSLAGPFIASYLDSAGEKKEEFRTDMIITTGLLTFTALIMLFRGGYFTTDLLKSWLFLLPVILLGTLIGIALEHRTNQNKFHFIVMGMVIFAGVLSLFSQLIALFG